MVCDGLQAKAGDEKTIRLCGKYMSDRHLYHKWAEGGNNS